MMSKAGASQSLRRFRLSSLHPRRLLIAALACVGRLLLPRRAPPTPPRRILLLKPDHLGDVLLCTPALRLLRQQHPSAHITLLVGPWSSVIVERNPDIDCLLTLPFPGFERTTATDDSRPLSRLLARLRPYGLLLRFALLLRPARYDTALLLRDDHWWGAALALLAGIPRRVGYATPETGPLLNHALPWNPTDHVTVQGLRLVAALAAPKVGDDTAPNSDVFFTRNKETFPLSFAAAPADHAWAAEWLRQHVPPGERLIILHPGTGGAAKLWLPERWASVGAALLREPGTRLLLTGGPGEIALVEEIAARIGQQRAQPNASPVLMLAGQTSVGQLAALLARAALVLGVDSGPLHLAVSQGTPTIHLFGPGNAARFGPWGTPTRHVVVQAGLWCSPCGVFAACPRQTDPPECMQGIAAALVLRHAYELLSQHTAR